MMSVMIVFRLLQRSLYKARELWRCTTYRWATKCCQPITAFKLSSRSPTCHRTKPSAFLQIYAGEPSETPLELSYKPMLFLEGRANPVPALLVKVGDVIAGANGPRVVTKIGSVAREGFYAPHSADGRIMVDGVLASAYTSFQGT